MLKYTLLSEIWIRIHIKSGSELLSYGLHGIAVEIEAWTLNSGFTPLNRTVFQRFNIEQQTLFSVFPFFFVKSVTLSGVIKRTLLFIFLINCRKM